MKQHSSSCSKIADKNGYENVLREVHNYQNGAKNLAATLSSAHNIKNRPEK